MLSHTELIQWIKGKAQTLGVGIEDALGQEGVQLAGEKLAVSICESAHRGTSVVYLRAWLSAAISMPVASTTGVESVKSAT